MACPKCSSHLTVPHGTVGGGGGGDCPMDPLCSIVHGLSRVSVPSHCPTWDGGGGGGGDCPRDSSVSHRTWLVSCVRPIQLSHMGRS